MTAARHGFGSRSAIDVQTDSIGRIVFDAAMVACCVMAILVACIALGP